MHPTRRTLRRLAGTSAAAVAVMAATATPVLAAPALSVTQSEPDGDGAVTLTVDGSGYDPARPGIYVAFTRADAAPTDQSAFVRDQMKYVHPGATPSEGEDVLEADGTFATTLKVRPAFTDGSGEVDCTLTACAIRTIKAHFIPDRSQDAVAPVEFEAGPGPGPDPDPGPGPGPGAPAISVSPSSGLSPFGATTIAVTGSGFRPAEPGIYVAFGPAAGTTNAGAYQTTKWVHPGATPSASQDVLSSTGTFSTTLIIGAAYTDGSGNRVDCTALACFVQTFAAHGSPDRTQDTAVAVGFAGTAPPAADAPPADPARAGDASGVGAAPAATGAGAPVAAMAVSKLRIGARGRLRLVLTAPGRVTVKIARQVKRGAASGPASSAKKARTRWVRAKTIRFDVAQAGPVSRTLRLRRSERYRIAVSVRGGEGAVVKAKPRVVRLRAAR